MKRWIMLILSCGLLLSGCNREELPDKPGNEKAQSMEWQEMPTGRIGDEFSITRAQAAKMMALAFYDKNQLENLPVKQRFADVDENMWYAPYINGAVEQGFLAGDDTGFHPDDALTLQQTQALLERLHPDHKTKINVTEQTRDKPVSYSLWMQIFEDALKQRRGEDSLYSYGFLEEVITPLQLSGKDIIAAQGAYQAHGYDMKPYAYKSIRVFIKDGEVAALLEVMEISPKITNVYYHSGQEGIEIETGKAKVSVLWAETEQAKQSPLYLKEAEGIGEIQLEQGRVISVVAVPNIGKMTVKKVDSKQVELEGMGTIPWAENAGIYEITSGEMCRRSVSRLICGTAIAEYYEQDGKISGAVIKEAAQPENIRVLLSNTGQKGYIHENVGISSDKGFTLSNGVQSKEFEAGKLLSLQETPEAMELFTNARVWAEAAAGGKIVVQSITRNGESPAYYGKIEFEQVDGGFRLINELPLEEYLKGVVPGEMPVSFGLEALKVQAVAARSYAYNQFYANRYGEQGAHVDDTTSTQVYVGAGGDPLSDKAIEQTKGICLTYGKTVVTANFFSSTCGFTASAADVWRGDGGKSFPGGGKPYLMAKGQGLSEDVGDLSIEENASKFLKRTDIDCFDRESPYVRWQATLNGIQLTSIINRGAGELWKAKNGLVQVENAGQWQDSGTLPVFQEIRDLQVTKRGQGGNVMILEITGDTGKIRVQTENAVRKLMRPAKTAEGEDIMVKLQDASERRNMSLLPSGFFVIEQTKDEHGKVSTATLFGGGNGHGVGMSQYGAKGMALAGYSYEEILEHYFQGAKAEKVIP